MSLYLDSALSKFGMYATERGMPSGRTRSCDGCGAPPEAHGCSYCGRGRTEEAEYAASLQRAHRAITQRQLNAMAAAAEWRAVGSTLPGLVQRT
jgi:hypothetical protein